MGRDSNKRAGLGAIAVALVVGFLLPGTASAAIYMADDPNDVADVDGGNGNAICDATGPPGCTLRAAVQTANGPFSTGDDIIQLPQDVPLSLGDLDVTANGNLEVRGTKLDGSRSVIDPNDSSRHFNVAGLVGLTLVNLHLIDGTTTTDGGAIGFNPTTTGRTLRLEDVRIEGNVASSTSAGTVFGGGISSLPGGAQPIIQIEGSEIVGNTAGDSDDFGLGGGISVFANDPSVTIANSTITGNTATASSASGAKGGGVYVQHNQNAAPTNPVTITSSTIDGNRAGGAGATNAGHGGGVFVDGGFANRTQAVSITGGSISNNIAGGGSGNAVGVGGAIAVGTSSGGGSLSVDGVTLSSNRAGGNDILGNGTGIGSGGAIATGVTGTTSTPLTVANSILSSNRAGIETGTSAPGFGGALLADGSGDVSIASSTFGQNSAGSSGGGGGALAILNTGRFLMSDSRLSNNQTAGSGGGISRSRSILVDGTDDLIERSALTGNVGFLSGGAIFNQNNDTMRIERSTLASNAAEFSGGFGGAIATGSFTPTELSSLELVRSTVSGNTAGDGSGTARGGGIEVGISGSFVGDLHIDRSTVADNHAPGALAMGGNIYGDGGNDPDPTVTTAASIIADGDSAPGSENCSYNNYPTAPSSPGGSVEDTTPTQCGLAPVLDRIGMDPGLLTLGSNGGPAAGAPGSTVAMQTHALPPGSPAVDWVTGAQCPAGGQDQRGFPRPFPVGGNCDSGAYELQDLDGDGVRDTGDNCPTQAGPAANGGCPAPAAQQTQQTQQTTAENPECEELRQRIQKLTRKIKRATDPDQKAKLKKKRRAARKRLAALGCAP